MEPGQKWLYHVYPKGEQMEQREQEKIQPIKKV